ncbi:MAG: Constitutive lysine decarboxylase [Sodalis sp.]|nr:MAG: Constitutive lysine decarboxylase [Sodalis sp.]
MQYIKQTLAPSIYFDSTWVLYTNFHPIYRGKICMSGERTHDKIIFETQSTHKLLAAFSQASVIHINGDYDERTFNEVNVTHTTISPHCDIVASIEMAVAMMCGKPGRRLVQCFIEWTLHFKAYRLHGESEG